MTLKIASARMVTRRRRLCDCRSGVPLQERQALLIELRDIFVKRRVRAPFEEEQLRIANAALEPICETRRRQLIAAPECDLGRRGMLLSCASTS